jgi:hypothetical protein
MIKVNIKLIGLFSTGRFKQKDCSCLDGARVKDVIEELQIPLGLLGIVLINGIHADIDSPLKDEDDLVLLPLLDGG